MKKTALRVLAVLSFVAFAAFDADAGLKIEHDLPVSFGVDAYGKTRLDGTFLDARVYSRVWTPDEVAAYSKSAGAAVSDKELVWRGVPKPGDTCDAVKKAGFAGGFTFACRVKLNKLGGRLLDNAVPFGHKGWLIDTYAGRLRVLSPGVFNTHPPRRLQVGKEQALVVTIASDMTIEVWIDGRCETPAARAKHQRYTPVPGGFEILNGGASFNRPLYGWHGDDWKRAPRFYAMASDRPKFGLFTYPTPRNIGTLSFDDGTEDVRFRYVYGRAEYEVSGKGNVTAVRSHQVPDLLVRVTGSLKPKATGQWRLRAQSRDGSAAYYAFCRKGTKRPVPENLPDLFNAACGLLESQAADMVVKTPDKILDSLVTCAVVAMNGQMEGDAVAHACTSWRNPFPGWRISYALSSLGRYDAFKAFARFWFRWQTKSGRVICNAGKDSIYNFNEVFVDSVLRYWLHSGDDAFMRDCAYEGVKKHLQWMEANMRAEGTVLFENWLNAWNTDNKWCNGGPGTVSSAYVRYAYAVMTRVAEKLGKKDDAAAFRARTAELDAAITDTLWNEKDGVWGEYRERFGHKRLMEVPDSSVIYTAIDSGLADADPSRARRALAWFERNVPSEFTPDGQPVIFSSNKLPRFYSTCGLYPAESIHLALAYWQCGEPEMAWRHYHSSYFQLVRGVNAGPGAFYHIQQDGTLENMGDCDFADTVSMHIRTVEEGLFGIVIDAPAGKVSLRPGFPLHWNEAEIKTPRFGYRWSRLKGVEITWNPAGYKVDVAAHEPKLVADAMPRPHTRWGAPKGDGCDLSVKPDAAFEFVDLGSSVNQDLRTLHGRRYSPVFGRFPWITWGPARTVEPNGRSWWESTAKGGLFGRRGGHAVPAKLKIPADGVLRASTGIPFKVKKTDGKDSVFTSLYDQIPAKAVVPLRGKASKLAFLAAVSTNPNLSWMEAARVTVTYKDGTSRTLSLVPPDNCDDWLNYLQPEPYHLKGEHIRLDIRAHVNVLAIPLDAGKELESLTLECRSTETLAGILAATLVR